MKKFKYTLFGQMLEVLKSHAAMVVLFSVLWLCFIAAFSTETGSVIFTILAVIFYFLSIYGCGEEAFKNDKKPYIPGEPSLKKSIVVPTLLIGMNILFIVLYKLTWVLGSDGESIQKMWSVITNILSYAWFSGFGSIPGMDKGSFSIIGIITVILLPEVAYILGYFAASKGFDYRDKLLAFMYEKKKNK
ncbi:MAG: hypothetical protein E7417_00680 [Ruminococcaceae bacterium]|nr:hypothetical protein [Oscillospiraceae bacterium]